MPATPALKTTSKISLMLSYLSLNMISPPSPLIVLNRHFEQSQWLYFNKESFNGQQFAYAACNDVVPSNPRTLSCQVFLETLPSQIIRSCNMTLTNSTFLPPRIIPLGTDRVIFSWPSFNTSNYFARTGMNFITVEMNSCTNVHTMFNSMLEIDVSIRPHDQTTFDILLFDSYTFCRWRLNVKNNSTFGPFDCIDEETKEQIRDVFPLVTNQFYTGVSITTVTGEHWLVIDDKKIKINVDIDLPKYSFAETSTIHNRITVCLPQESSNICWQFDLSGELTNLVNIHPRGLRLVPGMAVQNLKDGGLIVVRGCCEDDCLEDNRLIKYLVNKYNAEGVITMISVIQDFRCDRESANKVLLKFYESEGGRLCLMMACYKQSIWYSYSDPDKEKPYLDIATTCFD